MTVTSPLCENSLGYAYWRRPGWKERVARTAPAGREAARGHGVVRDASAASTGGAGRAPGNATNGGGDSLMLAV